MIKFLDLKKVNDQYSQEFKEQFNRFLDSGSYILGSQLESFENEFANFCGTQFCAGVSSGLDALQLIFEAYKLMGILSEGDEVIVPANTFIASVLAITNTGLKPILVEPSIETYNICPENILNVLSSKTKAILGVHLYGQLYDVEALEKISKAHNLLLIEDAAQAHGATIIDGRKAGNLSHAAAFSFYPTKNLGALGDAGAVTTNNRMLSETIMSLRNYGRRSSYETTIKGYNCRMDELQASFLRVKLKDLENQNNKRRELAHIYFINIVNDKVILPKCQNMQQHVFHQFVIRCSKRDQLRDYLYKLGIETLIHYPIPPYKQKAYKELEKLYFPISDKIHREILSLPFNTILTKKEVSIIIDSINAF